MNRDKRQWYTLVWKFGSTTEARPELLSEAQNSQISVMVFNHHTNRPFMRMASTPESAANFLRIAVKSAGMGNIQVNQL